MNVFYVSGGTLIHKTQETVNTGSIGFFKINFIFDNSWQSYNVLRFAEFYQTIDDFHIKVEIPEDGIIDIPTECLKCNLPIYVAVCAENEDREIIANTNFLSIPTNYGANTKKEQVIYPKELNSSFPIYSQSNNIQYLRINENRLEVSLGNDTWQTICKLDIQQTVDNLLQEIENLKK